MTKSATHTPLSSEDLAEVLQMYNEVTQRLEVSHARLEAEVTRLREQLEQKNRELEMKKRLAALGEMAAGMAHEIRNPLGGIQLYASTLAADVADRPAAAELVGKISRGVRSLNALVGDILAFAQNISPNRATEDLGEMAEAAVELARPTLEGAGVEVRIDPALRGIAVEVDGTLFGRVLLNLILNAGEAIREAGRSGGWIRLAAAREAERVVLTIEDNGPGIPAEALERIFNPFFTTKHTGTGLGLAIVHRIIEAHGGTITAENRPEGGARFVIQL